MSQTEEESGIALDEKVKTQPPPMYKVILLNDDYTPMDFVILVLKQFFKKNDDESHRITLQIHHHGSGLAGIYSKEVAEMKVHQVTQLARQNKHPLKCNLERED